MTIKSLILKLNAEEISRLTRILLDEEKEEALLFLKECLKPQLDQATRNQWDPFSRSREDLFKFLAKNEEGWPKWKILSAFWKLFQQDSIQSIQGVHFEETKMLLNSCKITRILPCIADPEKIRVIAEVSDEIHEVFPYLNAIIKGCIYNHPALTLTIRNEEKLITLHANHVTMTLIEDEKEAYEMLNWLKDLINQTYEKRSQIEPNYSDGGQLKPSDIQKLLPGTNCRECGFRTCLAFAFKLVDEKIEIVKCTPLFTDNFKEKRKVLLETLQNAGFKVPPEYLESS